MTEFKYCPRCKNNLKKKEEYYSCTNCNFKIYLNSKPCAGMLPILDGKVLLSKRAIEPHKGEYDIIGGFLKPGEHPKEGAVREASEETGLDIEVLELLGIYTDKYGNEGDYTLNIHYLGKIKGGKMKAQEDVSSLHWIPIKKVPLNEGFNNTKDTLKDLKKWYSKNK